MILRTPSILLLIALTLSLGPLTAARAGAGPSGRQFIGLSVPDAKASATWYQQAFGLQVLRETEAPDGRARVLVLGSDSLLIELLQHRDALPFDSRSHKSRAMVHGLFKVGFEVADLEMTLKQLRQLGAELMTADIVDDREQGLRYLLVRDNNGNLLQLFGTPAKAER